MKNQADEQAVEKGCARSVSTGTNRTGQAARDSGDSARKSAERYCPNHINLVILQKGYTYLKSRELEELPRFRVMSRQPS